MKHKTKILLILIITALAFSVIAFAIPFPKGISFWIAYIAELIAIALQMPIFKLAFEDADTMKSKFLAFPIARVGYLYLGVQTILSIVVFILGIHPLFPSWLVLVLCVIVLAAALICSISTDIAREEVQGMEYVIEKDVSVMKSFRTASDSLLAMTEDAKLKSALVQLAEEFRFSDPVSSPETAEIERELTEQLHDLKDMLSDRQEAMDQISVIRSKLSQRNAICKNAKH